MILSHVSAVKLFLLFEGYYSDSKSHVENMHALILLRKDVWIKDLREGLLVIINIILDTALMS